MTASTRLSRIKPLFIGRLSRFVAGAITVGIALIMGAAALGVVGWLALILLGVSFLVGGLIGNPGCEVTALPNLVLPASKRLHFP